MTPTSTAPAIFSPIGPRLSYPNCSSSSPSSSSSTVTFGLAFFVVARQVLLSDTPPLVVVLFLTVAVLATALTDMKRTLLKGLERFLLLLLLCIKDLPVTATTPTE